MGAYNFKNLSSYDFEILTKDLLQKILSKSLENFKSGRDGGIDIRYLRVDENIIVQCKHYADSKYSNLIQTLKNEIPKIKILNPTRYIIVTSLGLTPLNKNEIFNLLAPYILNQDDIYDSEALNSFLRKYPSIVKTHFKLWLSSTAVLERILHSSVINNSQITKDNILKTIQIYVECDNFFDALKILKKYNYCIISGIPGIGKTTLAKILSYKHIESEYEFITISNIKEGFELLAPEKKQIFYYDDFLGTNHFINKNEETEIISFIEHISKSKVKRFIMTTREYIYNQALSESEILNRFSFKKCIIKQEDYNKIIKAKILYNHLYFANLPQEYYKNILNKKNYQNIINHRNYTPRIIEWMTNIINAESIEPENYYKEFINNLNNPLKIWRYAFENYISVESRYILLLLGLTSGSVEMTSIKQLLKIWKYQNSTIDIVSFEIQFNLSLKELENTFIAISNNNKSLILIFHNPSIQDYIMDYINENISILNDFLKLPVYYWDQYIFLLEISESHSLNEHKNIVSIIETKKLQILKQLIDNIDKESFLIDVKPYLFSKRYTNNSSRILYILNLLINNYTIFKKDIDNLFIHYISILELSYKFSNLDKDIISGFYNLNNDFKNNQKLRQLLKSIFIESKDIEDISYLININLLFSFIDNKDCEELVENIQEIAEDIDIDIDDIAKLEEIKSNIKGVFKFFDLEYPLSYYSIDERINKIEEDEASAEDEAVDYNMGDYKESRFEERLIENEIINIFETLR